MKQIYFLHIPKTAGKSIALLLKQHYNNVMPYNVWDQLYPEMPLDFTKYELTHGHFGYSLVSLLPSDTWLMTFLRNPVERVISHYYHILKDVQDGREGHWITKNCISTNLMETLQANPQFFSNYQARYLYHCLDVSQRASITEGRYLYDSDPLFLAQPDDMLRVVRSRLDTEFGFVGVTEKMDAALDKLSETPGIDKNKYLKCNVGKTRPPIDDIDPAILKYIEELNEQDFVLWERAYSKL